MKFKSAAQRKAVMANLNQGRTPTSSANVPYQQTKEISPIAQRDFWATYWDEMLEWDSRPEKLYNAQKLAKDDPVLFKKRYSRSKTRPMTNDEFEYATDELDEAIYQYESIR